MNDVFGYNREIKSKEILSADNVSLDLGDGKVALVQNVSASYMHQVAPMYEVGSSNLYFVNGQPMGQFSFGSLVGKSGFFSGFNLKNLACGDLKTLSVNLKNDNNCELEVTSNSTLKFEGAVLNSIGFQVTAQQLYITQEAQFTVAKLIVSE